MAKRYLFLVLLIVLSSCNKENTKVKSEKYSAVISDSIVYDFLNNTLLKENDIYRVCHTLIDRKLIYTVNGEYTFLNQIDTLKFLTQKDKEFISLQFHNSKLFKLNDKFIKDKQVIVLDTTANTREKRNHFYDQILKKNHCYSFVSLPVFNLSKTIAIVECKYECGALCGEGAIFVYQKNIEGVWKLIYEYERWIS